MFISNEMKERDIDRLFNRLAQIGMSDVEFARAVNESAQTIYNWKKRGQIPGRKLFRVAAAINVSPEWLQYGRETAVNENLSTTHALVTKLARAISSGDVSARDIITLDILISHMTATPKPAPNENRGWEILSDGDEDTAAKRNKKRA